MIPTNYDQLYADVVNFTGDPSDKLKNAFPTIAINAMLMVARGLPLSMYDEIFYFAIAPGQDEVLFRTLGEGGIKPVAVDYLMVMPHGLPIERRSQAYLLMHGGRGVPRYFCDLGIDSRQGVKLSPKPIQGATLAINYSMLPDLSKTAQTNWYTDNVPDLMFSAVMVCSAEYTVEAERVAAFGGKFQGQLADAKRDYQDMLRQNNYQPLAQAAVPAPKGGSA